MVFARASSWSATTSEPGWNGAVRPPVRHPTDVADFGAVLAQDARRVPEVQKGLRSRAFAGYLLSESENRIRHYLAELDRFCGAMIAIREEIRAIETGEADRADNVLKNAPHTLGRVTADDWTHPYSRSQAAYPAPWVHAAKFWPSAARIESAYGDRNLVCSCPPTDAYVT